jgi:hypothetical protein
LEKRGKEALAKLARTSNVVLPTINDYLKAALVEGSKR